MKLFVCVKVERHRARAGAVLERVLEAARARLLEHDRPHSFQRMRVHRRVCRDLGRLDDLRQPRRARGAQHTSRNGRRTLRWRRVPRRWRWRGRDWYRHRRWRWRLCRDRRHRRLRGGRSRRRSGHRRFERSNYRHRCSLSLDAAQRLLAGATDIGAIGVGVGVGVGVDVGAELSHVPRILSPSVEYTLTGVEKPTRLGHGLGV
mmetsp:Transcript_6022/g.12278  ORF Transcript_6022/g.12278 Transcript_6022/m.12278 type:complete len:204 (+) Transcript_6022:292-903(+)